MIFTSYKKIDEAGRVVVSKDIRKQLSLAANDLLKIDIRDNAIIMKKAEPCCEFCGNETDLIEFKGKNICKDCLATLNSEE